MNTVLKNKGRAFTFLLLTVSIGLATASLFLGSRPIPLNVVWDVLVSGNDFDSTESAIINVHSTIWELRIPRTFLAYCAGAALAIAGVLAQSWTRNPLADPGFIGITAGASFMVAIGSVTGIVATTSHRAAFAVVGAALAAILVLIISHRSSDPITLVLVGVGISAAFQSSTTLIALFSTKVLDGMRAWNVGSTFGRGYEDVSLAVVGLFTGSVLAYLAARPLDLLAMGEETSTALGGSPNVARSLAAIAVIVLAGFSTAAAGPIAFVGFAAPHLTRRYVGQEITKQLLPSALLGGILALAADIIGRLVLHPGELEMSIVLAIIGAPALIIAVHRGIGWKAVNV